MSLRVSDFSFVPLRHFFYAALAKRWKVQFRQGFAYFNNMLLLLWRSIASDEDVSESYGVSAAQSWTRKCDHTGGMQQQPLGQVFILCGPGAYDRDPANVSFGMPGHPYEHQVVMRNGLRQEFPNSVWIGRRPPRMLSGNP